MKLRRYVDIDVLRGLAAFWVVLSHYLPYWNRYLGDAPVIVPNSWGVHGVKLFFGISGFVIFMTLERCKTVADFAVLRISRIYPAYWTALFLATAVSALVFGDQFWLGGFIVNATMLQDFVGYPRIDNVYWSLSVELAFYLIAGTLFALRLHRRTLAFVVVWLVLTAIWSFSVPERDPNHRHWLALLLALDFSPYFAMGIVFFDVVKHGWSLARAGVILLALATEVLIAGWEGLCVGLTVAVLLALALRAKLGFLVSGPTIWLGTISYSLYLVHRNLGYKSLQWMHENNVGAAAALPITILGALALATMVTYGIEKPALHHIRSWYDVSVRRARR